jgi:hypothetical protein
VSDKTIQEAIHALAERELGKVQAALNQLAQERAAIDAQVKILQLQNASLVEQRTQLEKNKVELQRQKELFATGLFAALIALAAAVIGQIPKWATLLLDRELKRLDIQQRRKALEEPAAPVQLASNHDEDEDAG